MFYWSCYKLLTSSILVLIVFASCCLDCQYYSHDGLLSSRLRQCARISLAEGTQIMNLIVQLGVWCYVRGSEFLSWRYCYDELDCSAWSSRLHQWARISSLAHRTPDSLVVAALQSALAIHWPHHHLWHAKHRHGSPSHVSKQVCVPVLIIPQGQIIQVCIADDDVYTVPEVAPETLFYSTPHISWLHRWFVGCFLWFFKNHLQFQSDLFDCQLKRDF